MKCFEDMVVGFYSFPAFFVCSGGDSSSCNGLNTLMSSIFLSAPLTQVA